MQAIDAATEVFTTVLLPDRKLCAWGERDFRQLPGGKAGQRQALFWLWEDLLKARQAQTLPSHDLRPSVSCLWRCLTSCSDV